MEKDFEVLIAGLINNKIGISEHFLNAGLVKHLKENMQDLHCQNALTAAGTGNAEKILNDTTVRGDSIYWLDRQHENKFENEFFDRIDDFISYLNRTCYTGITGCEFHYSLYEAGSFYRKHLDQFNNNSNRQYSMITYLNDTWQAGDGGELMTHQDGEEQKISPTMGKTVFFKSDELEHEVLLTSQRRMSLTGWLKKDGC